MKPILNLPLGSKITILDMIYYEPYKYKNSCEDDVLFILYKDVGDDNKKKVRMVKRPKVELFFTKPENRKEWNVPRSYIEKSKVYSVECRYTHILGTVYKELKDYKEPKAYSIIKQYQEAIETKNYRGKKILHKHPHVFMSDLKLEDYYLFQLITQYDVDFRHDIRKAFGDIEADVYGLSTMATKNHEDRVNAITLILPPSNINKIRQIHVFILKDFKKYPQQVKFLDNMKDFEKDCHKEFDKIEIKRRGKKMIIDYPADYHFHLYDNDGELISAMFKILNEDNPDTFEFWNIGYDYDKMANRLIKNGLNPATIMSTKPFPEECWFCDINIDDRISIPASDKKTYIRHTSTIKPLDMLQIYAGTRKGGKDYGSNKLDNIARIEAGIHKREFDKPGTTIVNAPVREYYNFILYNINDTILLDIIDQVTNDSTAFIVDTNTAGCLSENVFKQTRYLKGVYYSYRLNEGFVSGNNTNVDYGKAYDEDQHLSIYEMEKALRNRYNAEQDEDTEEESYEYTESNIELEEEDERALEEVNDVYSDYPGKNVKFRGGIVGNPNLKTANGVELIPGIKSKHVFSHCMDFDYLSKYPWLNITRSVSGPTQYGRLIIPKRISDRQNEYSDKYYSPGAEFTSDYISQDFISFGNIWFNLPTFEESLREFDGM